MHRNRMLPLFMLLALLGLWATGAAPAAAAPARDAAPPNDARQARLRVSQCVLGGPAVDVYVNGQVAVSGGVPLTNVGALLWTGYLYLAPGTYSVALVPTGQGLDHAVRGPLDVTAVAGHRYSLVALGQADEASHPPLLIDETTAYQAIGGAPPDDRHFGYITVNNIKGTASVDVALGAVVVEPGVDYGGFKAALVPSFVKGIGMTLAEAPHEVLFQDDSNIYNPPGTDFIDCWGGHYPGEIGQDFDAHSAPYTTALDTASLLQKLSDDAGNGGQSPSFNTFLAALQTTGLRDLLTTGGPYMLFPPSDEAFAALPPDQRAELLSDPRTLATVLRSFIVAGYYPPGSLMGGPYHAHRTATNLLGQPLALQSGNQFTINGEAVGNDGFVMTANGSRIFVGISKVLMPVVAPGMPTTGVGANPADLLAALGAGLALLLAGGLLWRRPARLR